MFDIGWMELMLIGVVALVVIGPQDLPDMFRQLGRFTAKLRTMAREFQRAMDQAARESGAADLAKDVKNIANPKSLGVDAVRSAADRFEKWDPLKNAARPSAPQNSETIRNLTPPPMPPNPLATPPAPAPVAADPAPVAAGPATQALYDKKAAKAAVLKEAAERIKAIETGTPAPAPAKPPRKSRAKPAAAGPVT